VYNIFYEFYALLFVLRKECRLMDKKGITISYSFLKRCALIYITLPLFCFFIGWLKWYWLIVSCLALVVSLLATEEKGIFYRLFHKGKQSGAAASLQIEETSIVLPKWMIAVIALTALLYCYFCGIGRLWGQTSDYAWRNAIFRDLIMRDWPVYYDKIHGALSYYFGMWLPAAIPGKIVYLITGGNYKAGFFAGNIAFLIYYAVGITLLFLLILLHFKKVKPAHVLLIIAGFIFFSGMDIVGSDFKVGQDLHIEWWAIYYQYSSFTTCICWVFNQSLITWICMALLINETKVSNYVLIGMACLFCSPFPFLGYFIYCVSIGVKRCMDMVKAKQGKDFLRESFSVQNVCAALFIFPFIAFFLISNSYMNESKATESVSAAASWGMLEIIMYLSFLLYEFGLLAMLIAKKNRKNYLFYVTVIQLIIYPLINIGINSDLTMRASMPAIFMMFLMCYKYLLEEQLVRPKKMDQAKQTGKRKEIDIRVNFVYLTLVLCLLIGAVTPCVEFYRGGVVFFKKGINDPNTDYVVTFNRETLSFVEEWPPTAFITANYEDVLFFKYFAREKGAN